MFPKFSFHLKGTPLMFTMYATYDLWMCANGHRRTFAGVAQNCCIKSRFFSSLLNCLLIKIYGKMTEWSPFRSVIMQVINKIGRPRSGTGPIC